MVKRRILIVDDEVGFARLLSLFLEGTGRYQVTMTHRGRQALEAARAFRPDLILLDVVMPDLDGSMVAEQLQQDAQLCQVPIIFLTAVVSREEAGPADRVIGGHVFIAKPASMDVVLAAIEKQLAGATADRPIAQPSRGGIA